MPIHGQTQDGDSNAGPLGELRSLTTAAGGSALSTSVPILVPFPKNTTRLQIIPCTFAGGATVCKLLFNPWLIALRTTDLLANVTDYSENAQDGDTATLVTLSAQPTAANGGYLYVGSHVPFSGLKAAVTSANAAASVLSGDYWNGTTWANITATDGTASGGATMAISGNITWTVPSAWAAVALADAGTPKPQQWASINRDYRQESLYWVRLKVSAVLSATVTLNELLAINRSTAYAEYPFGATLEERVMRGLGGTGSVQALIDVGTAKLIINAATALGGKGLGL